MSLLLLRCAGRKLLRKHRHQVFFGGKICQLCDYANWDCTKINVTTEATKCSSTGTRARPWPTIMWVTITRTSITRWSFYTVSFTHRMCFSFFLLIYECISFSSNIECSLTLWKVYSVFQRRVLFILRAINSPKSLWYFYLANEMILWSNNRKMFQLWNV